MLRPLGLGLLGLLTLSACTPPEDEWREEGAPLDEGAEGDLALGSILVTDSCTGEVSLSGLSCGARGLGVSQDMAEAVTWYRKAADQGHAGAQYYLGIAYHKGQGVPADQIEAYKWLSLAIATYPPTNTEDLALATKHLNGVYPSL